MSRNKKDKSTTPSPTRTSSRLKSQAPKESEQKRKKKRKRKEGEKKVIGGKKEVQVGTFEWIVDATPEDCERVAQNLSILGATQLAELRETLLKRITIELKLSKLGKIQKKRLGGILRRYSFETPTEPLLALIKKIREKYLTGDDHEQEAI
jgi:hypothetical protein